MEEKKRNKLSFLLAALLLLTALSIRCPIVHGAAELRLAAAKCNVSIAECHVEEEEFLMESEIHRRFLKEVIGNKPLIASRPICNTGGKPYTGSCVPPRSGNPPNRGCQYYNNCRH